MSAEDYLDIDTINLKVTYYCPKCGRKTLCEGRRYQQGGESITKHRFYACAYNRERNGSRSRRPAGPPCGAIIEVTDRNAEISDYGDVLAKMAKIGVSPIQQWLLENDREVSKRGMEVLYEGVILDVVRRHHNKTGVGVALYWKGQTYEREESTLDPIDSFHSALRSEAANYVSFGTTSAKELFRDNGVEIWNKDNASLPFSGGLGKKLKEKIVQFAARLERTLPRLFEECQAERRRWEIERGAFKDAIAAITDEDTFEVRHYSGETHTIFPVMRHVRPAEALKIAQFLGTEIKLSVLHQGRNVTPEMAIKIEQLTEQEFTFNINHLFRLNWNEEKEGKKARRLYLDEAITIAKILKEGVE